MKDSSQMNDGYWLFSYGTLGDRKVQQQLFGREVETVEDRLDGFRIETIEITDPSIIEMSGIDRHPILRRSHGGKGISGLALRLSATDLIAADRYEAAEYRRIKVTLASGRKSFVYVRRESEPALANDGVRLATPDDELLGALLPVARQIFTETFASLYDQAAFERFCDDVYLPGGSMSRDFATSKVSWQVALFEGEPIGYAKLTPLRAPAVDAADGAMELQQIYVLPEWHGTGVADRLMEWGLATAEANGSPEVYLTVFDHNERAKHFYRRHGFEEVGRCVFQLGDRIDDDRIWRRRTASIDQADQSTGTNSMRRQQG